MENGQALMMFAFVPIVLKITLAALGQILLHITPKFKLACKKKWYILGLLIHDNKRMIK